MSRQNQEVEVKLGVADVAALRRMLRKLGARKLDHVWERNTLYDTPRRRFQRLGRLLRLRVLTPLNSSAASGQGLLTYKGPSLRLKDWNGWTGVARRGRPSRGSTSLRAGTTGGQRYKVREEIEVEIARPEKLRAILQAVGLLPSFRYEKIRTSYVLPRLPGVKLELDETPIGIFVELEGSPRRIDRAARLLGYGPRDYITRSYLGLHLGACRRRGLPASDMVFPRGRGPNAPRRKR